PIPIERRDLTARRLELSDMPFILENYHHPGANEEHIRERLNDYMVGAFVDGKCAGFAGIHEEGAIGLLEVLPEYRRRGIAEFIESHVINWCIRNSRLPYCHVMTNNAASIALQEKLKLTFDTEPLYWLS
ncbi:MAG: GNAT family N-acetyltransferase, partial [Oscillospiraceae bacterium]